LSSSIRFLTPESVKEIHDASLNVLENTGISVNNEEALEFLEKAGCKINSGVVRIPSDIVKKTIESVPSSFMLYSRDANESFQVGQDNMIFNPGSSSLNIIDSNSNLQRSAVSNDLVQLTLLVDALEFIHAQSTALTPSDVPKVISDSYRLYIILKNSNKPIITGAFTKQSFFDMLRMLEVIAGGTEQLAEKPRAIFDCCPSSPLTWSDTTCQNLIDCSRNSVPAEIIPAPQIGATSPITLTGTLIQSNAEILCGIVVSQLVKKGAPIVYGSAPFSFDMRFCTGRVGAIEAMMTACAAAELGKFYRIPTHAFLGVSDSNAIDAQSGFETAFGIMLATLARINIVSGPGMLSSLNSQSLEKIVIDDEMCGASYRLLQGIQEDAVSLDVIDKVGPGGHFIGEKHTRENFANEHYLPSALISRLTTETWQHEGSTNILQRARDKVDEILQKQSGSSLPSEKESDLNASFIEILKKYEIKQKEIPWGL
jgi:trimethylamine--corrinoid protein Co-methyltransferase